MCSAGKLPKYWGGWFSPLGNGDMKETNLNVFYRFGEALENLGSQVRAGMELGQLYAYLVLTEEWVLAFLKETEELMPMLKETRISTNSLLVNIQATKQATIGHWVRKITPAQVSALLNGKEEMEKNFEREHRNLCVFTVTRKAIYDTRALVERPEDMFPENLHAILGEQMLSDLKQAGRCLAFEIPTACAFHICRGTEAVMIKYLELLMKTPWPYPKNRDWHAYIQHMENHNVPKKITDRLNEIRLSDRNAYNHPDINVPTEEATIVFGLCTDVVFLMGKEMSKLI